MKRIVASTTGASTIAGTTIGATAGALAATTGIGETITTIGRATESITTIAEEAVDGGTTTIDGEGRNWTSLVAAGGAGAASKVRVLRS